jgi:trimeric autotransporter adhesin
LLAVVPAISGCTAKKLILMQARWLRIGEGMAILTVPFGQTVNGIIVSNGDIQDVYGKTVDETIELGGIQNVYGEDTGSIVRPEGVQYVYGVSTKETIEFGGTQYVYGKDIDSTILGYAVQHVYGIAARTTVDGDQQIVETGGVAIDATLNSLGININNYGSGVEQLVNSGGTAIGTVINMLAYQFVLNGGLALNSTVNSGGYLVVAGGGTLEGRTQINGGEVVLLGTATTVGSIIFSGSNGRLDIGGDASNFHATIYKFAPGDIIDLNDINFGSNTKLVYHSVDDNAGTLTVTDGTTTEQIKLVGHYTQADFAIAQAHGNAFSSGTIVTDLVSQGHSGSDIFHWL